MTAWGREGGLTMEDEERVCCFRGFCRGGGRLSARDLLGTATTAGARMFCALFREMAVNVTALHSGHA